MENDLQSSEREKMMANGHKLDPPRVPSMAALGGFTAPDSTIISTTSSPSPAKMLSNIQPKMHDSLTNKRQIVPKSDGLTSAVQQLTAQPSANLLVPQGIQHVLINGNLYPIIQTANGTHLLIQQPVGQVQPPGKQLFTAQPIQLGTLPPATCAGPGAAAGAGPSAINSTGPGALPGKPPTPSPLEQQTSAHATPGQSTISSVAPVLPQASSQITPSNTGSGNSNLPQAQLYKTANSGAQRLNSPFSSGKAPVPVDAKTQQLLTRIQNQIDAFKTKPTLDRDSKMTLLQLQQAQQRVLSNVRNQAQMATRPAVPQQTGTNGAVAAGPLQPSSFVHPTPQFVTQQVLQSNVKDRSLIIKPATDGASPVTEQNVAAIIEAFTNVKVGNQIYNIQLMEDQKKTFVEEMSRMDAEQQHSYLAQQQMQILQTVFKNQQELQMKAQTAAPSQPAAQFSQPSTIPPPANPLASFPKAKSAGRPSSGRRSANRGRKVSSPSTAPVRTPTPSITLPDPSRCASKKPRPSPHMSTKRIGEKMLQQIMKDQEVLLKPGNHKKAFVNKNQVKERLLRFHLFYTAGPYKAYRRLQEEQLYRATAHETVLNKERLMDDFRKQLWHESTVPSEGAEDMLIAQLLLQDEKDALEEDELMEIKDIDKFKELYRLPEKEPTPPISPQPATPQPASSLTSPPLTSSQPVSPPISTDESSSEPDTSLHSPAFGPMDDLEEDTPHLKQSAQKSNKTLLNFMIPEADVLNRVKRETAREARERRAAKRRETDSLIAQGMSTAVSQKGRGVRRFEQPIEDEADELPLSGSRSPTVAASEETSDDVESIGEQKVDYSTETDHGLSGTREDPVRQLSANSESSSSVSSPILPEKSSKASDTSRSCSSDSEDELIDIGSPLTPPTDHTSPVTSLACQRADSPLSSPSFAANDPNSPRKGFSIYSETVIEQSEQAYMPMTYQQPVSTFDSGCVDAASHFTKEAVPEPSHAPNTAYHHTQHCFSDNPIDSAYDGHHKSWPLNSDKPSHERLHDSDATDVSSSASTSCSEEEEEDVGGVPVTWENNSVNVPSEAVSEEDTDLSTEEGATKMRGPNVGTSPIMPLRIDKRKLEEYSWSEERSDSESPLPKEKVTLPPPIKLRIKRDRNDKWEAASSVSSYTSQGDESEEEQSLHESDTEQLEDGSRMDWEDSRDDDELAYSNRPDESDDPEESSYQHSDDADDMVPFVQYASEDEPDTYH